MKKQFVKKLAVIALAVGMLLPIATPVMQTKADAKKDVWVLNTKNVYGFAQFKYMYNENGLLTEEKCVEGDGEPSYKYAYKGTKISKSYQAVRESASDLGTYALNEKYTYNKAGRLVKSNVTKYTWKSGHVISDGYSFYSYDKNGWITKLGVGESMKELSNIWLMEYDEYGYMTLERPEKNPLYTYANKYKDGRLVRRINLDEDGSEPDSERLACIFKYKKIQVPTSRVKQVKLQQDWLTNKGGMQLLPLAAY